MAEDKAKKTKIDLKARLGKTMAPGTLTSPLAVPGSVGPPPGMDLPGGATSTPVPAPPGNSGVPAPMPSAMPSAPVMTRPVGIPAPSISPGIPMPPFAPQPRPSAQPSQKPTAQAQTIKVEIGEEIHEERKKASRKAGIYALLAVVVGLGVGYVIGGAQKSSDLGARVQEGSKKLEGEVRPANDKMKELSDKLTLAGAALNNQTWPDDLQASLATLKIPFDSTNIEGKQVGNFPGKVQHMVYAYTSAVEDLDKKREALKNLLGAFKEPVAKYWKEQKEPMVAFAVTFRQDGGKVVGELAGVKTPFAWGKDPEKITIVKQEGGKPAEKNATRWLKGDLAPSDPVAIPIDPKTLPTAEGPAKLAGVQKAIFDMRKTLEGGGDEDPTNAKQGVMRDGDDLANELHKIAVAR